MIITTTLVLVGITVLSLVWLLIKAKTRNVKKTNLPSPPRHWLLGHILVFNSLDSRPMLAFHQLKRSLGSLFHLDMLKSQMVFVGGYPELKEILNGENCECRKSTPIGQDLVYGMKNTGILMNPSPDYKELRRFSLKCLRDLGLGKHKSEAIILEESKCLNEEVKKRMKKNSGKFLQEDLERLFAKSSLNIIWNFVSAERFEYDDKMAEKLLYFSDCFTKLGKEILGKPLGIFPFLKHIPPFRSKYQEVENGFRELRQFIRTSISNHEDTLDINNPRDYIDMFLIEAKETKNPILTKDNLMAICLDLFIAGSETTSNSLLWDLAFMINHQDVQDAVRDELDEAAGDSMITLRHKDDIPLTEATINEVWRMGNVGGITPPRNIKEDFKCGDFEIPAGSVLMTNYYSTHMDEEYWKDPEVFRPRRFISEGKYAPDERLIPFGLGRRKCLGENLARMENLLLFANMVKCFKFKCLDGELPILEPEGGLTYGPKPFSCSIELC